MRRRSLTYGVELLPNASSMYINHDWVLPHLIIYPAFGHPSILRV
jgi:hypothetical protein